MVGTVEVAQAVVLDDGDGGLLRVVVREMEVLLLVAHAGLEERSALELLDVVFRHDRGMVGTLNPNHAAERVVLGEHGILLGRGDELARWRGAEGRLVLCAYPAARIELHQTTDASFRSWWPRSRHRCRPRCRDPCPSWFAVDAVRRP